jgi:SAM-dependent methyltransferase
MHAIYVQYGAGSMAPDGWLSYDISPTLRLSRIPLFGRLVKSPFPPAVRYGDIVRGLPIADGTADGVFCSHVLEHLARADADVALANTYRMLKAGGRFRLIVPDLAARVQRYLEARDNPTANDRFMRELMICSEGRPRTVAQHARALFGNSLHRWMWDYPGMSAALTKAGFVNIHRCRFGDSGDAMFDRVEREDRFVDAGLDVLHECAIDCRRPLGA